MIVLAAVLIAAVCGRGLAHGQELQPVRVALSTAAYGAAVHYQGQAALV